MRYGILTALVLTLGCRSRRVSQETPPADSLDLAALVPGDSADSALHTPLVVTRSVVVVFWLAAGDTLHPDDAAAAFDELSTATEAITPALTAYDIPIYATHAETVYVELPNRQRRPILLSGLDLPFGYVLVEPGGAERILTGTYADEELLDEVRVYFDLPEDSLPAPPKIST